MCKWQRELNMSPTVTSSNWLLTNEMHWPHGRLNRWLRARLQYVYFNALKILWSYNNPPELCILYISRNYLIFPAALAYAIYFTGWRVIGGVTSEMFDNKSMDQRNTAVTQARWQLLQYCTTPPKYIVILILKWNLWLMLLMLKLVHSSSYDESYHQYRKRYYVSHWKVYFLVDLLKIVHINLMTKA